MPTIRGTKPLEFVIHIGKLVQRVDICPCSVNICDKKGKKHYFYIIYLFHKPIDSLWPLEGVCLKSLHMVLSGGLLPCFASFLLSLKNDTEVQIQYFFSSFSEFCASHWRTLKQNWQGQIAFVIHLCIETTTARSDDLPSLCIEVWIIQTLPRDTLLSASAKTPEVCCDSSQSSIIF